MTTRDLLAEAYDLEQAGDLIGAAALRAQDRGQQLDQAPVDAPIAPDAWALLFQAATGLYQQGKADGERAILQAMTDAVMEATPAAPRLASVQDDHGETFSSLVAGEGLTEVRIAQDDGQPGVLLTIGGSCINQELGEIITLDDVRQLRDNLSAILADPRLGAGPVPAVSIERLYHEGDTDGDLTEEPCGPLAYRDYCAGDGDTEVAISFDVTGTYAPDVDLGDQPSIKLDRFLAWLPNLLTLLADPRVQAERAAYEERQQFRRAA